MLDTVNEKHRDLSAVEPSGIVQLDLMSKTAEARLALTNSIARLKGGESVNMAELHERTVALVSAIAEIKVVARAQVTEQRNPRKELSPPMKNRAEVEKDIIEEIRAAIKVSEEDLIKTTSGISSALRKDVQKINADLTKAAVELKNGRAPRTSKLQQHAKEILGRLEKELASARQKDFTRELSHYTAEIEQREAGLRKAAGGASPHFLGIYQNSGAMKALLASAIETIDRGEKPDMQGLRNAARRVIPRLENAEREVLESQNKAREAAAEFARNASEYAQQNLFLNGGVSVQTYLDGRMKVSVDGTTTVTIGGNSTSRATTLIPVANETKNRILISFTSVDNLYTWPDANSSFVVEPDAMLQIRLSGPLGVQVSYAAFFADSPSTRWGRNAIAKLGAPAEVLTFVTN